MKLMNPARLLTWALVMAMPLWFASCKNDNGGPDPVKPNSVEGSWKISGMKLSDGRNTEDYLELIKDFPGGAELVACLTDIKITFNGNGKISGTTSPKCQSEDADDFNPAANNARWSVNGSKITVTDDDGPETYDLSVDGNTMKWSSPIEEDLDGDGTIEKLTMTIEFRKA
ncbi:hypothetical protein DYU11_23075 [Fibrisoma montanum]|uniref:Lipocalin-like domain-containing protein n=1 Tax=Fibrisoma montanum TaxID=2305895 RepID=A0A418M241_9BACT|nr:lipocalin family protein [Fibrisoma montanum]RIV19812.1 hypothetical protein DYU11_23075 [Fibrisoma montanum]